MPNIQASCEKFSGRYVLVNKSRQRQNFSAFQILRAIATVGFQSSSHLFSFNNKGRRYRLHTGLSVLWLLEEFENDFITAEVFAELDGSEKAVVSYWLGVAFAKLLANSELQIPWLAHVDPMISSGTLTTKDKSKTRGDFVGIDRVRCWHIVEAKGRSNQITKKLIADSKNQAMNVKSINGSQPETTSTCLTFLQGRRITTRLIDPPSDDSGASWNIDQGDFFRNYYKGLTDFLLTAKESRVYIYQGRQFITAPLPVSLDTATTLPAGSLRIGLLDKILENPNSAMSFAHELPENERVSRDGIITITEDEASVTQL